MNIHTRTFFARAVVALLIALVATGSFVLARTAAFSTPIPRTPLEYATPPFDEAAAAMHLRQALQFETVTYDDVANIAAFDAFRRWLVETYPRFHAATSRAVLGGGTLLYEWTGTDASLKPVVLMAHQDVVPAPQPERWKHPPFSGALVEGTIWGRGALDDKGRLIAILEAAESLLAGNFTPTRTVFFVFGHDEEIGGENGARLAAQMLAQRRVKAEFVLDEGGISLDNAPITGRPMTLIGVSEKGYLTLRLQVVAAGGHSNAPGNGTAVDTLARAIVAIRDEPMPVRYSGLTREMMEVVAPHASFLPRMAISNSWLFEPLLVSQLSTTPQGAAMLQTTIAPTMLEGSPKQNVLPSTAAATINMRILPGETIQSCIAHVRRAIGDLPVTFTVVGPSSEPTPIASTQSSGYRLTAGLAMKLFDAPVAPLLMIGMTDSRHMRVLTDDIYRFAPLKSGSAEISMAHGFNERISLENFNRMLWFYQQVLVGGTGAQLP